jgi:hypothetical protein
MDLLKLGRNTKFNTVPFYKLKIGTPVYLWDSALEIDDVASLFVDRGPEVGEVTVMYSSGKKVKYLDKNTVVIGEMKK